MIGAFRAAFRRTAPGQIPVFGVLRFSILFAKASGMRQMEELDLDQRRELVFDPARMEERFRFFEAFCWPTILAQDCLDWDMLLIASTELPEPWRGRLERLVAGHAHVHLHFMRPTELLGATIRWKMGQIAPADAPLVANFRLDDDDALSSDFVTRLRANLVRYPVADTAFTFPNGVAVQMADAPARAGPRFHVIPAARNFGIGAGLTLLTDREARETCYNLRAVHSQVDTVFPTVSDSSAPVYVISAHEWNDSDRSLLRARKRKVSEMGLAELRETLGPRFAHLRFERLFD